MNRKTLLEQYAVWCEASGIASDGDRAFDLQRLAALPPADYECSHTFFTTENLSDTTQLCLWRDTTGYEGITQMGEIIFVSKANDGGRGIEVPQGEEHPQGHFTVIRSPIGELIHSIIQHAPQIKLLRQLS